VTVHVVSRQVVADRRGGGLPPIWWKGVVAVAAAMVAVELGVAARYGFHRDELYFLACARHLAWGYVDQPPFVPMVAWLSTHLMGTSPVAVRVFPALAAGATVILTACMARELGGSRRAQLLAALAAATSPQVLAAFHLLSTTAFDLLFWAAISFVVLRLLRTRDERLWLVIGALVGLGLLNKVNVGFLVAGVVAGFVLGGRSRDLRSPWLGAGAALALLIFAPNVVWNATHDWASLAMMRSLHQENSGLTASLTFIPAQFIVVGPVLIVFWLAGLRRLLASSFARALGIAFISLLVLFAVAGAKTYYLGGMYFALFAGGGVWVEERMTPTTAGRTVRRWAALMLVGGLIGLPLALPVLPESMLARGEWESKINKDLSATVGWNDFVKQVDQVANRLPGDERANLVVFTGDYGAAGAVDLYGSRYRLPHAISGHNSYWWWGPAGARNGTTTIAVDLPRDYLLTIFSQVQPAGTVTAPYGVWTEERGDPIWICRGQKETWAQAWRAARHYG
jgi:4-amino-4-deoxy-L-arabinose transferase-like glycosyltransferase